MFSAIGQVRFVALWHALLGAICTLGAAVVINVFLANRQQEFGALGIGLWIYICAGTAFWAAAVLSLQYLTLGTTIQNAALALSILLAIAVIVAAVGVTLSGWNGRTVISMWWGVAAVCTLCSFLLWRKRRASDNCRRGA
jgi:hypothetical protein